ncbi:MAG: thiol peroxidase [Flavobacteriales bacterium]
MPQPKLSGLLPSPGIPAPQLRYVKQDRSDAKLADLKGEVIVLLMFPSLDTSTCALETRKFNKLAVGLGARVLAVTMDLPFAMKRFCLAEGIDNVETGSDFRYRDAGDLWGARLVEGNLNGTLARVTWVIDKEGTVRYMELAPELAAEPNYDAALEAARALL